MPNNNGFRFFDNQDKAKKWFSSNLGWNIKDVERLINNIIMVTRDENFPITEGEIEKGTIDIINFYMMKNLTKEVVVPILDKYLSLSGVAFDIIFIDFGNCMVNFSDINTETKSNGLCIKSVNFDTERITPEIANILMKITHHTAKYHFERVYIKFSNIDQLESNPKTKKYIDAIRQYMDNECDDNCTLRLYPSNFKRIDSIMNTTFKLL